MPGILAIDQALCTGWAYCEPGQFPQWGHKQIAKNAADDGEIVVAFNLFMCSLIERFAPRHLIFETPYIGLYNKDDDETKRRPVSARTITLAIRWTTIIILVCETHGVHWQYQGTQAAVNLLTGKGKYPNRKAKKAATVAACWARGWKATEDEADALALLLFAESRLYPREAKERAMVFRKPTGQLFA